MFAASRDKPTEPIGAELGGGGGRPDRAAEQDFLLRAHMLAEEARVSKRGRLASSSAALLDRANLTGLVLGCIKAKFCKKICV